ncbi:type IV secretion system DNA-binding domain-containing protein [Acidipila rosea]|uniref:type IV secretion system DNA-binding domain-containing protein n=1 Tax=Acidipila rosea TaxID=768535 RepID=UPI003C73A0AF
MNDRGAPRGTQTSNPVVMGLPGRSQMEKRYGKDAEAMLSQPATKIFLKISEPRVAKWINFLWAEDSTQADWDL